MTIRMLSVLSFLKVAFVFLLVLPATVDARITNVDHDLPYEYSFSREYVVAGERILRISITNNTEFHIEALEIQVKLLDAFREPVSDWSTFVPPDLEIAPGETRSLSLTLSRRNILGATVQNVLDQARYADIRYGRLLFSDGTIVRQHEIYPELRDVFGSTRVHVLPWWRPDTHDSRALTLVRSERESASYATVEREWGGMFGGHQALRNRTIAEIADVVERAGVLVRVEVTNVSQTAVEKDWATNYPAPVTLLDEAGNQYSNWALVFAPQANENVLRGREPLRPNASVAFYYVFDQIDGYKPRALEVFIDGQQYHEGPLHDVIAPDWYGMGAWNGRRRHLTTDPFETATSEWRIVWETGEGAAVGSFEEASFTIFLYDDQGTSSQLLQHTQSRYSSARSGEIYVRRPPGRYHLRIQDNGVIWTVRVEERRRTD